MSKPSRFIINSDFATTQNDAEGTVSVTIPSTVNTLNTGANKVYSATINIGADASSGYRFYVTSSKYSYAISSPQFMVYCKEGGYESSFYGSIYRVGKSFKMEFTFAGTPGATNNYTNCGQVFTLHIQSFLDPFQS